MKKTISHLDLISLYGDLMLEINRLEIAPESKDALKSIVWSDYEVAKQFEGSKEVEQGYDLAMIITNLMNASRITGQKGA